MTIRYEANPPKILLGTDTDESIRRFIKKIKTISKRCNSIHLTENVLGHQRVSPLKVGKIIKEEIPSMEITASLRVRDKNEDQILQFVKYCIAEGFAGVLVLMGDPSHTSETDSGQIPSAVVKRLHEQGIDKEIDLYLSISNRPNFSKIGKKIQARPKGFMTQVIQDIQQVRDLSENLKGFSLIPILLYPSPKNQRSAEFLNLDLVTYRQKFEELIEETLKITNDILLTSPSDFESLDRFLERMSS